MKPLHIRLAAWGTVLVLAAVAFNLRVGSADEVEQGANGPQVNGRTSQGEPIWAVLDDGRVREIRMQWAMRCDGGRRLDRFGLTARDVKQQDGGFTFTQTRHFDEGGGWTSRLRSRIEGSASRGTASVEIRFSQGDVDSFTCRAGPVRWTIP